MNVHQLKIKNGTRESKEEKYFACSRVANIACRTRHWFESSAKRLFFFRSVALITIDFWKFFFAYDQRYPLEISTATGVIDHADSEYVICFSRELIFQNPSTVICRAMHYLVRARKILNKTLPNQHPTAIDLRRQITQLKNKTNKWKRRMSKAIMWKRSI